MNAELARKESNGKLVFRVTGNGETLAKAMQTFEQNMNRYYDVCKVVEYRDYAVYHVWAM